jgi:hypothetical protein
MTYEELETRERIILENIKRQADIDPRRDPGVEAVIGQIPGLGYADAVKDNRWVLDLMQEKRLLDKVNENTSGSFALRLTAQGLRFLALSNN